LEVPEIDVDQLEHARAGGASILDVREPHEWDEARIEGAAHIPLADVPERIDEIPEDGPVYVICAGGGRSRRAAEYLMKQGLDAHNVAGGMVAWLDSGKPTIAGPDAR
jgi:rhodanese-related sulfurtransferase